MAVRSLNFPAASALIRFGAFELDLRSRELRKDGRSTGLPEQSIKVLHMLLERPGELVLREEIRARLWPNDTVVEFDHSINAAMRKLRVALGDSADSPRYIETLARRGYRWIGPVEAPAAKELARDPTPPPVDPDGSQFFNGQLTGKKVSHYRVLEVLGGGGMGVVYKAEDLKLGRRVALKFLPDELAQDPIALKRLEQEARAASALNHPNVCTIYEIAEHDGRPFIVMEFMEGETLRERISGQTSGHRPLSLDQQLDLAIQASDALATAHSRGIIHRDIKPANLFVTRAGVAKILDFGVAKLSQPPIVDEDPSRETAAAEVQAADGIDPALAAALGESSLTRTGVTLGTAGYMSPEQVRGEMLDARTDLFSFGLVLYEMATARAAFAAPTAALMRDAILHNDPTPVRELNPDIPEGLALIIRKALEKEQDRRYQSAAEISADLQRLHAKALAARNSAPLFPVPFGKLGYFSTLVLFALLLAVAYGVFRWTSSARHIDSGRIQMTKLTDNGQVQGVAISPNAKYVAYAVGNEFAQSLWLHEFGGGQDVELLPTGTQFRGLTFSHDNAALYFARADAHDPYFRYLYSMPAHGGAVRKLLTDVDSPVSFSPDGTRFVYERGVPPLEDIELKIANMDGSDDHVLTVIHEGNSSMVMQPGPNWSPDGQKIAVAVRMVKPHLRWVLDVISVADGSLKELYSSSEGIGRPVWLTGGSALLFPHLEKATHRFQIWTVSFPDGRAQPLTHDLSGYGIDLDASGDGRIFVTTAGSIISQAWIAPASDPSAAEQVTSDALPLHDIAEGFDGRLLTRGQDGTVWMMNSDGSQRIRFTDFQSDGLTVCGPFVILWNSQKLIRLDKDGSHPTVLAQGNVDAPECSADKASIFYFTWDQPNRIWKVPVMGGTPQRVDDVLGDQLTDRLTASPDGRFLAYEYTDFRQVPAKGWRIAVIPRGGGSPVEQFAGPGYTPFNLRWSPDGKSLQFLITRNRATNLWEQPLVGGETKQLTRFTAGEIFNFNWSSDGMRLLLTRGSRTTDAVLLSDLR